MNCNRCNTYNRCDNNCGGCGCGCNNSCGCANPFVNCNGCCRNTFVNGTTTTL